MTTVPNNDEFFKMEWQLQFPYSASFIAVSNGLGDLLEEALLIINEKVYFAVKLYLHHVRLAAQCYLSTYILSHQNRSVANDSTRAIGCRYSKRTFQAGLNFGPYERTTPFGPANDCGFLAVLNGKLKE